jgi:hypothetical protein
MEAKVFRAEQPLQEYNYYKSKTIVFVERDSPFPDGYATTMTMENDKNDNVLVVVVVVRTCLCSRFG